MIEIDYLILALGIVIVLLILANAAMSLRVGSRSIFPGSGAPTSMAQMLLSSIHITSQHLIGALVIIIVSLLMKGQVVKAEAGLAIVSAVIGYILGRGFEDVGFGTTPAERRRSNQENSGSNSAGPER